MPKHEGHPSNAATHVEALIWDTMQRYALSPDQLFYHITARHRLQNPIGFGADSGNRPTDKENS